MKILVVGSGGREHALIWKLHEERPDATFYAAPGNGGTQSLAESVPIKAEAVGELAGFAGSKQIDLTLIGPEAPLALGIVDLFEDKGLRIFGPTQAAAEIESSKAFAKELMVEAGIPTAGHRTIADFGEAERYIRAHGAPVVVKASGLAAGKGAIVCRTVDDAVAAARSMLTEARFGEAGSTVVIEDFLDGEELSVLFLTDGVNALPLLPSQDHKPIGEGDTGPNTGGMGAYAPVSIADDCLIRRVMDRIVEPGLAELRSRGRDYRGVLYCGLMIIEADPYVVEFNCRFGDPETQAILPLMKSSLLEAFERVARGASIRDLELEWSERTAVCTVVASGGYPDAYEKGRAIHIPDALLDDPDLRLFHAGTVRDADGRLVTSGGRVLGVVGLGDAVTHAVEKSRAAAGAVDFDGAYFRRDIGYREISRAG